MLPDWHHACAETTGADLSSRMNTVSPFSNVTTRTSGGTAGIPFVDDESAAVRVTVIIKAKAPASANAHFMARGSYTRRARGEGGRVARRVRFVADATRANSLDLSVQSWPSGFPWCSESSIHSQGSLAVICEATPEVARPL